MPTQENTLKKKTFPELDELSKRIYYILTDAESIKIQRVAKTLGLLIEHLSNSGILSVKDIEDMLFEVVRSNTHEGAASPAKYGYGSMSCSKSRSVLS